MDEHRAAINRIFAIPSDDGRDSAPRTRRHANGDAVPDAEASVPLIGAELVPLPPLAGPEIDDLDDRPVTAKPQPGVDDGFFDPGRTDVEDVPYDVPSRSGGDGVKPGAGGVQPMFPYAPGFGAEFGGVPLDLESIPDVNIYQHKKTVAQGMMDLALFSANANQLRYVLESSNHPYYYAGIVLISISLVFQVAIGVGLILNTRYDVKDKKEICIANKISNFTIVGIFLVTVINVFISAFGVANNV